MSNKIILEKNSTKIVIQSYKNYWLINESYTFYKKN